jgi:indolepyruvate ferredoxin oxidoreductase
MLLLGVAVQLGLVPVSVAAIQRAIELNAVAIELNQRAFALGRLWAHDPQALRATTAPPVNSTSRAPSPDDAIEAGKVHLSAYQNIQYAQHYERLIRRVASAEGLAQPGSAALAHVAALQLRRLMAYKDEYEVARLHTDPKMNESIDAIFAPGYRLTLHLAPPMFARRDPATGHLRKREFGSWIFPALKLLAKLKGLRGTAWDPFGHTAERRAERALRDRYMDDLQTIATRLERGNFAQALAFARWPEMLRGFGHVKERSMHAAEMERKRLLANLVTPQLASGAVGETITRATG